MANNSLRPLKADAFDTAKAQHLLNRAGFGGTPGQIRALADMGLDKAVAFIVDYGSVPADPIKADLFDHDIMRPASDEERSEVRMARQRGDEAAVERYQRERMERQNADRRQMAQMQEWWLKRMIETPRPMEEKMTLFWHGHFATGYRKIEDSYHMFLQNQLFRSQAVGNFRELARAIVRDPAMIAYLDNNQNRQQAPNENLARELMELFTLGEGHGYTETDIKEGARALTGNTFEDDEFIFRRGVHDPGTKQILGKTGKFDGDDFVKIIFDSNTPSEFLCWKLYRYFVNDLPGAPDKESQDYIVKLAAELRQKDYELKPMLKTMFLSERFYDLANTASQVKSPVQLVVQAVHSLHVPPRNLGALVSATDLMGQNIFYPPSVKGWDGGRAWINTSTMFVRQNVLVYLLTGRRPDSQPWEADGTTFDATPLLGHMPAGETPASVNDVVAYLLRFNLGAQPLPQRVEALLEFVNQKGGNLNNDLLVDLLALITAMPEYQLC